MFRTGIMKYTRYFSQLVKSHGTPQLSNDHISTFLNIIHLEAKVIVYADLNRDHKYDLNIRRIEARISQLTNNLDPKQLIQKWVAGESIRITSNVEVYNSWDPYEADMVQLNKSNSRKR